MIAVPSMRPEPARDRYGRYLLPDPVTGVERSWTRATTIAHALSDQYHLGQWKRRKVAEGLARAPELVPKVQLAAAILAEVEGDWRAAKGPKAELDALCDEAAAIAGANQGSEYGTALHSLTEWYDAGRLDEIAVPAELIGDLDAYSRGVESLGLVRPAEWIERVVVNTQVGGAGTFDRLLKVPGYPRLIVGDLKTQKSLEWGFLEIAIQLAEYAYAEWIVNPDTGALEPMPEVDREVGLVLHLPVGKATLTIYEVDLTEGWAAAMHAHDTRAFRDRSKVMGRPWAPRSPGPATEPDRLTYLIRHAGHPDALTALWRNAGDSWTADHTKAAAARKAELVGAPHSS